MKINKCRFCKGDLKRVLSLRKVPVVNRFLTKKELGQGEKYPLRLVGCKKCGLVQLDFIVSPDKLFLHYDYLTSASKPLVDSLEKLALFCIRNYHLGSKSRVLDIGCNDGSFLEIFKKRKITSIGIEPSRTISKIARKKGLDVTSDFFNLELAGRLLGKHGSFDLICATRVMANILSLSDFAKSIKLLLSPKGVFIAEVSSLSEMLKKGQFDAVYHEHYSYFSEKFLHKLFGDNGLTIFKIEKLKSQGGELRIFATHKSAKLKKARTSEKDLEKYYSSFAESAVKLKKKLRQLIKSKKGARIIGLGAPAKAVTLLNYCGLDNKTIARIADSTSSKQGKYMPGVGIPIFPESDLLKTKADYYLLLAWNYKDEMLKKMKKILPKNSKVIIPFPKLEVLSI